MIATRRMSLALALLILGLSASPATAQKDAERSLERAVFVEETEQNLEEAARLYRAAVDAAKGVETELGTRALHQLALCVQKMGREEEAGVLLRKAAAGKGAAADQAKEALSGRAISDPLLLTRISRAIEGLREDPSSKNAVSEIQWIGEAIVPYLAREIEQGDEGLQFVRAATRQICEVGGPAAERFLMGVARSPDLLLRRSVAKGLPYKVQSDGVEAGARAFLDDRDGEVRRDALRNLGKRLGDDRLLKLADDAHHDVMAEAYRVLGSRLHGRSARQESEFSARIIKGMRSAILEGSARQREVVFDALSRRNGLIDHASGQSLILELLRDAAEKPEIMDGLSRCYLRSPSAEHPVSEWVETARVLGPLDQWLGAEEQDARRNRFALWVMNRSNNWGTESRSGILELARLGYSGGGRFKPGDAPVTEWFSNWLFNHGNAGDFGFVIEAAANTRDPHRILGWLQEHNARLSSEHLPLLDKVIDRADGKHLSTIERISYSLAARRGEVFASRWLMDHARTRPRAHSVGVTQAAATPNLELLRGLALIPGGAEYSRARAKCWELLWTFGDDSVIPTMVDAYVLIPSGSRPELGALHMDSKISSSGLAALVDGLLTRGGYDVKGAASTLMRGPRSLKQKVDSKVADVLARFLPQLKVDDDDRTKISRNRIVGEFIRDWNGKAEGATAVGLWALESEDRSLVETGLVSYTREHQVPAAVIAKTRALLAHSDHDVVVAALSLLGKVAGKEDLDAVESVAPP